MNEKHHEKNTKMDWHLQNSPDQGAMWRSLTHSDNNSSKRVSAIYLFIGHLFIYFYLFIYSESTTYLIRDSDGETRTRNPWITSPVL